jgi:hypothetical protein
MKGFKAMEVKFGINKYDKVFDRVDTDWQSLYRKVNLARNSFGFTDVPFHKEQHQSHIEVDHSRKET